MTAAMPHRCWPEGFPHPRQGDPRPSLLPHTPRPAIFKPSCPPSCPPGTPVTPPRPSQHTCLCGLRLPSSVLHPGSRTWEHSSLRNHGCCLKPRELLSGYCRPRFWKVHPVLARFATSPFPPEVSCSKVQARLFLKHGRLTSVLCLKSGLGLPVTRPLLLARADLTCAVTATTHRTRHVTSRV